MLIEDAGALWLSKVHCHWSAVVHPLRAYHHCCRLPRCSRPTLGVSCKLSKSNLSVCSILFTPAEFIHIFITGAREGSGDARRLERLPADQLVPSLALL